MTMHTQQRLNDGPGNDAETVRRDLATERWAEQYGNPRHNTAIAAAIGGALDDLFYGSSDEAQAVKRGLLENIAAGLAKLDIYDRAHVAAAVLDDEGVPPLEEFIEEGR